MNNKIIIRYSEIALKKGNRRRFENQLAENIRWTLKGYEFKLIRTWGRFFITDFKENEIFIEKLKKVPGISNFSISEVVEDRTIENIAKKAVELLSREYDADSKGFFKVATKRLDKKFHKNSAQISKEVADIVLPNFEKFIVNLSKPDITLGIEFYEENALVFTKRYRGVDGLPVGSSGKMTLLLSGGIDSPVAGYKIIARGVKINAVYYHSVPYTSEGAKLKVIDLKSYLLFYFF